MSFGDSDSMIEGPKQFLEYIPLPSSFIKTKQAEKLSEMFSVGKRIDNRELLSIRPVIFNTNVSLNCNGSCYLSMGSTKVMCSVFGPNCQRVNNKTNDTASSDLGTITVEVTFPPYSLFSKYYSSMNEVKMNKSIRAPSDLLVMNEESQLASRLLETFSSVILLDKFPDKYVDICLLVIENGSGLTSAAINCVSLALADAKIPIRDLCVGINIVIGHNLPNELLNPNLIKNENQEKQKETSNTIHNKNSDHLFETNTTFILMDPLECEINHINNKIAELSLFGLDDNSKDVPTLTFVYIAMCCSNSSVALCDIEGYLPVNDNFFILSLAETACNKIAENIKKSLCNVISTNNIIENKENKIIEEICSRMKSEQSLQ